MSDDELHPHVRAAVEVIDATGRAGDATIISPERLNEDDACPISRCDRGVELMALRISREGQLNSLLRHTREDLRRNLETEADVIVSAHPGHFARAALNFYLLTSPSFRAQQKHDSCLAKELIHIEDDFYRLSSELDYGLVESQDAREYDPPGRLARYPGHFTPICAEGLETARILAMMNRHCEVAWKAYENHITRQVELLRSLEHDREVTGLGEYSLLMLKGGGQGQLYGTISSTVLRGLCRRGHFEVSLGHPRAIFMEGAIRRWDYFEDRIKEIERYYASIEQTRGCPLGALVHSREVLDSLANLKYGLKVLDHWRVHAWIDRLRGVRHELPAVPRAALSKIFTFTKYVLAASQYMLVRRLVPRECIMKAWGTTDDDLKVAVTRAVKNGVLPETGLESGGLTSAVMDLDEQDFVKLVLVGSPDPAAGQNHTLRAAVRDVVRSRPAAWLDALAEPDISADDVASIANGVHGPLGPTSLDREIQHEIALVPLADLVRFRELVDLTMSSEPRSEVSGVQLARGPRPA